MNKEIAIPLLCLKHHGGIRVVVEIANEIALTQPVCIITPKKLLSDVYKINPKVKLVFVETIFSQKALVYAEFIIKLFLKLKKYDLYIANFFITMFPVVLCSIFYKKKYLYLVQDIESKREKNLFDKIFNIFCELTYKSNFMITANDYLKHQIQKRGQNPLFEFTVGVDDLFFKHPASNLDKKYDLIYFARSQKWKNLDMFLDFLSFSKEKPLIVAVVSQEEELFEKIKMYRQKHIHHVVFIKPKTQTELIDTIDLSKIFVGTSKKEGFYLPAIESMARGVPSLLHPNGGSEVYFKDNQNGRYFTNIEQLNELVLQLLSDTNLYEKYSVESKKTALNFNMQVNIKKVANFICNYLVSS